MASVTVVIGLTGGIAAGKSAALDAFAQYGAEVFSTDLAAHRAMERPEVRDLLIERWGESVVDDEGRVDRDAIASRVFGDPDELSWLEGILHPEVRREVASWREQLDPSVAVAVVEVPLLFESGLDQAFDATVAVVSDDGVREQRLAARGQAGVEGREDRQLTQQEKVDRADHVIRNEGTLADLAVAVAEIYDELAVREGKP